MEFMGHSDTYLTIWTKVRQVQPRYMYGGWSLGEVKSSKVGIDGEPGASISQNDER